jgi:hypothetical protein
MHQVLVVLLHFNFQNPKDSSGGKSKVPSALTAVSSKCQSLKLLNIQWTHRNIISLKKKHPFKVWIMANRDIMHLSKWFRKIWLYGEHNWWVNLTHSLHLTLLLWHLSSVECPSITAYCEICLYGPYQRMIFSFSHNIWLKSLNYKNVF